MPSTVTDEQRFELLVTSVRDYAIYMLDCDGYVASWNAGAQRFKGYLANEIVGRHFSEFYTPEDRAAGIPEKALRMAIEQGKFEGEGWRVRKDGTRFWASVVVDPIRDATGELVGFAKITRDISEQKQVQEALRRSEQQFRLLVQGVTDYAIYMLSPAGDVTSWNAGAARIKGYEHHEIIGQHFSRFYTEEDRANGLPALTLAIAARDGRVEREGWRVRKDGSRFWANVVVDAIRDDRGSLVGFAKVTRDITERKEAAAALDRANAALFQSQKMEAIGQLTGGVAHDFNNLLAVLSNGLQVLNSQSRTHLDTKMLETMQRAVERGASLTQQLLSFARQQPLKAEPHDLNKVIRAFEPMLQRAGDASIRLRMALDEDQTPVIVDAGRFETALLNLVVNARDALPDGGSIEVGAERVDVKDNTVGTLRAGRYVRVWVADTGTGMPPEVVARAFEPFFTTKEPGKGTGLGLSQVYGFIVQSGGDVEIHSKEGEGTTISIYLQAAEDMVESSGGYPAPVVETVLLVEDEPDLLAAAAELFRSIGYEVVTASNGTDAVDILKQRAEIDIVFSDIVMAHGMSGLELARQIRERHPHIKIVLASGYPLGVLRREHGDLSDFTFIHKPYRLADLAKALRAG
ncbi:PAS domain-containing sensor histidine kinase [Paraburkholderia sp. DHOC27]|uniref:hybrid sensor histidine kinase/response regulator n=1 Tax=Paraburkholderia sp. DHOC27 TaxID=2303330 RepID=UPI000E3C22DD|nr:PAS domain-containing sensor histidine kinase [Paraburkholderia sp. DHOC27]RFU48429.1 PAS domain-containing sensor histidine kinase [Paraburkholderia sp. DHOC27]